MWLRSFREVNMNDIFLNRLMQKVELVPFTTCWIWTGACVGNGYGITKLPKSRTMQVAHRAIYERIIGEIPKNLELDHLCRNRFCVNPSHLEPVTHMENLNRAGIIEKLKIIGESRKDKTHCKRGHEFSGGNLSRQKNGSRLCLACVKYKKESNRNIKNR